MNFFKNHVQSPQLSPSVSITVASSQHQKQTQVTLNSDCGGNASHPLNLTIDSGKNPQQGATYQEQSHQQNTQQWLAWSFNKIKQKNHYLQNLIVYKDALLRKYDGDLTYFKACLSSQQQEYSEQKLENVRLREELETLKNCTATKANFEVVIEHNKVISENNAKLVKQKQDLKNELECLKSTEMFWKELREINYSMEDVKTLVTDMAQVKIRNNKLVVERENLSKQVEEQENKLEENKATLEFLEDEVFQLRNEVSNKLREQNELTGRLNEATSRLTQLNAEIEHMKKRQVPLDKLCESLKNNKLQLTKELERTQCELKEERSQTTAKVVRKKRMLLDNAAAAAPAVYLSPT